MENRKLSEIAFEIADDWKTVNFAAQPYLTSMAELNTIDDVYYLEEARSVVLYFLSNATGWKGETAQRIKAELNAMI